MTDSPERPEGQELAVGPPASRRRWRRALRSFTTSSLGAVGLILVGSGLWVQLLFGGRLTARADGPAGPGDMTVQRLTIVDGKGKRRVVIAGPELFPDPVIGGKSYPRAVKPAGVVFYNSNGDESGGLGLSETKDGRMNMLV